MIVIEIRPVADAAGSAKLAEAEVRFTSGPLAGLTLTGFGIWQSPRKGRHVTFPSRMVRTDGLPASVALLRPSTADATPAAALRTLILRAYAEVARDEALRSCS